MGFWDRFKKKPKDDLELASDIKMPAITAETTGSENVRAKMDLVLTQIESMNIRMETLGQRLERLERMVQEIWTIAKQ
jgi:hypothetical protein